GAPLLASSSGGPPARAPCRRRCALDRKFDAAAALCAQHPDSLVPRAPASAVFRGRVVHLADASPVLGADVWLVSANKRVLTDSAGSFRSAGCPPACSSCRSDSSDSPPSETRSCSPPSTRTCAPMR